MYGEEIRYKLELIKPEDYEKLQAFSCGNEPLDKFIHNELIVNNKINDDALPYKYIDIGNEKICAVVSLAASGISYKIDNYISVKPAVKIDIFAVDKEYQKNAHG